MAKNCCKYFTVSLVPVASLVLAVLFALGIVALPIIYVHLAHEYRYGIIIDAGSSHTGMYFYRWELPKDRGAGDIDEKFHCYSRSLNSFTDPSKAGKAVEKCIEKSKKENAIPKSLRKATPLFLGATAGMRLVRRKDPGLSDALLSQVNSTLEESGYDLKSGRIITGQEEAVAGWVSSNYLSQGLQDEDLPLMGSLDLGGASTQIAFLHSGDQEQYQTHVKLYDRVHSLYARSYLCYGQNEANLRLLAHLINSTANVSENIDNPCLLKDAKLTYNQTYIYSSVCVNENSSEIFGSGFSAPSPACGSSDEMNFTFRGTGDAANCREVIRDVFDLSLCSDPTVCVKDNYFWPPVNNTGTFLGMSGFFYVAQFFNHSDQKLHNLTNYNHTVHRFCSLTDSSASKQYPDVRFLQHQCFDGVYSLFLLQTGYGFNSSNHNWTIKFVKKVNGKTVSWASGYLLNQTTAITDNPHEVERPFRSVDLVMGIVVLSILCVVFVIFFFLTFYACRRVLKTRGGYSNIS